MKKLVFIISFLCLINSLLFAIQIPTQSSPANGANNQATGVTLWINTVSGATEYDYLLDTVITFDSPALRTKTHTSAYSGWTPYDLYYGQIYYWKIRARNTTETSDWSSVFIFTTNALGVTQSSPADGATNLGTGLTLSVNVINGSENIDYQVDVVSTFDSPDLQEYTHTNSYSGKTISSLEYGQTYYWRVRGRNDTDTSEWTSTRSFTTNIFGATQSSPADGATNLGTGLTLSVNVINGSENIDYQVDVVSTFDSPNLQEYTHTNSYSGKSISGLDYGQTYYWRVRGRNANDVSDWTSARSFNTNIFGATQSSPADGATNLGTGLTLSVNVINGSENIDYQVDVVSTFDSPDLQEYTHTNSYSGKSISGLDYGQTYYWRVRGRNANDVSDWTSARSFNTNIFGATQSSPADGVTNLGTGLTLSVNVISGSENIDYQVDVVSTFDSPDLQEYTHTNSYSGKSISGLDYGQTYYWRVRGRNANDVSDWTSARSFNTNIFGATQSSPADGATNLGTGLTLSVNVINGSENIDYQVDVVSTFDSPDLQEYTHTNSYSGKSISGLDYGQTYYWRVRGRNANDVSDWTSARSFNTSIYGAVQSSPASGLTGRPVNLTLYVTIKTGTDSVDYQLDTTINFNSQLLAEYTHSSAYSGHGFSGLRYGQEYFWRVRGRNSNDTSQWTNPWTFTTEFELTSAPVLNAPHNDSIGVPFESFNIVWNSIENVTNYQYQISLSSDFTQIVRTGNTSLTFKNIAELSPSTEYYWRVRGENVNGYSPWSVIWSFTTESVDLMAPIQISPANGAVNQPINVTLDWDAVFGANSYTVLIAGDSEFTIGATSFGTSETEHEITGLSENFTFYWKVKASDGYSEGPWSEVWQFTTLSTFLSAPDLISPANNSENQNFNSLEFEWNLVNNALTYTIEISSDPSFNPLVFSMPLEATSLIVTELNCETHYYWRVKAVNSITESSWSDVFEFTTDICSDITGYPNMQFEIYPNPASDIIYIKSSAENNANVEISDLSGKRIYFGSLQQSNIELTLFSPGVYIISIANELGEVVRKKFIKQ